MIVRKVTFNAFQAGSDSVEQLLRIERIAGDALDHTTNKDEVRFLRRFNKGIRGRLGRLSTL